MQLLNKKLLDNLSEKAQSSQRLRMNHNLHNHLDAPAQRLFNALEPGTVLPVHRHRQTDETYILVCGRLKVLLYNNAGHLIESIELNLDNGNFGIHINAGQWHTVEVLESGTVIFEVKDGPYTPLGKDDIWEI
jgi:cupin fold WbuC family metalloprotein